MVLAMLALLSALWGGLLRMGWSMPMVQTDWIAFHGPLMVGAFLGTVIGLEKAVALQKNWAYLGPLSSGISGVILIFTGASAPAALLLTMSSALMILMYGALLGLQKTGFMFMMVAGAVCWLLGNILWLYGFPLNMVVWPWMGFILLTIAGERLELGRLQFTSAKRQPRLYAALSVFAVGAAVSLTLQAEWAIRLAGLGMLGTAAWLGIYDLARRTVRQSGLTRLIAVNLLAGYGWLSVTGVLISAHGLIQAGFIYDAVLHTFFVGFVFSMIFGHARIIFPAVLRVPVRYHPAFYAHVVLLHLSLFMRVSGDLSEWIALRQWGGMLNATALLLFIANMVRGFLISKNRGIAKSATA